MNPGDFRCSAASARDGEPMLGTAPTSAAYLFVEYAGAWGRDAVAQAALPQRLRDAMAAHPDVAVHLIRHHGRALPQGVQVFAVVAGLDGISVEGRQLASLDAVAELDLAALAAGQSLGLDPLSHPLWLVCTNGKRDLCCSQVGRPVAAALAAQWPECTWEVNHLGGHRFAGTLLALPWGLALGRLEASTAVASCAGVVAGDVDAQVLRGRIGVPGAAQVAQAELARQVGVPLMQVRVLDVHVDRARSVVTLSVAEAVHQLTVLSEPADARRQSCGDDKVKSATRYRLAAEGAQT